MAAASMPSRWRAGPGRPACRCPMDRSTPRHCSSSFALRASPRATKLTVEAGAASGWPSSSRRSSSSAVRLSHTEPGRGTRFTIELPLTLSITEAMIAVVGDRTFAVPQGSVRESSSSIRRPCGRSSRMRLLHTGVACCQHWLSRLRNSEHPERARSFSSPAGWRSRSGQ